MLWIRPLRNSTLFLLNLCGLADAKTLELEIYMFTLKMKVLIYSVPAGVHALHRRPCAIWNEK